LKLITGRWCHRVVVRKPGHSGNSAGQEMAL
jgi:hypothetical protein